MIRDPYGYMERESDFNPSEVSHESYPHNQKLLKCPEYLARLEVFRLRLKSTFHFDNCYTHKDDPNFRNNIMKPPLNVTRRTQTYERDIAIGYDPFAKDESLVMHFEEEIHAEIKHDYVGGLLDFLVDKISEEDSFIEMKKETVPDVVEEKESSDSDFEFEKNTKKRKKDLQFDLDDIMGMFDIDDYGNLLINFDTMRDNLNRKVNRHGYLIDNVKNIIN